jgi:hypothetical protein
MQCYKRTDNRATAPLLKRKREMRKRRKRRKMPLYQ